MSNLTKVLIGVVIAGIIFLFGYCSHRASCENIVSKSDTTFIWKDIFIRDTLHEKSTVSKIEIVHDTIHHFVDTNTMVNKAVFDDYYSTRIYPVVFTDSMFNVSGSDTVQENKLRQSSLIIAYKGKSKETIIKQTEYKQSLRLYFTAGLTLQGKTIQDINVGGVLVGKHNLLISGSYAVLNHSINATLGYRILGK